VGCTNPDEFLFWDTQHVTTAANQLIADAAFETLETESIPEPTTHLGLLGLGVLGITLRASHSSLVRSRLHLYFTPYGTRSGTAFTNVKHALYVALYKCSD
jgi:phospholipase/lecithinase/hemolysin